MVPSCCGAVHTVWRSTYGGRIYRRVDRFLPTLSPVMTLVARKPDDWAAILFTSGSEGVPKGVVLSHCNMLANAAQARARIDFNHEDKIFNVLPVFHGKFLQRVPVHASTGDIHEDVDPGMIGPNFFEGSLHFGFLGQVSAMK